MLTRKVDSRKHALNAVPISYLIQTANQFLCEIYVTDGTGTANLKRYEEMKNLKLGEGHLTFHFRGSDETEAGSRILGILLQE